MLPIQTTWVRKVDVCVNDAHEKGRSHVKERASKE